MTGVAGVAARGRLRALSSHGIREPRFSSTGDPRSAICGIVGSALDGTDGDDRGFRRSTCSAPPTRGPARAALRPGGGPRLALSCLIAAGKWTEIAARSPTRGLRWTAAPPSFRAAAARRSPTVNRPVTEGRRRLDAAPVNLGEASGGNRPSRPPPIKVPIGGAPRDGSRCTPGDAVALVLAVGQAEGNQQGVDPAAGTKPKVSARGGRRDASRSTTAQPT